MMLVHSLVIERATAGAPDDYGQPSSTFSTLATVRGLVQPKSAREKAQANQAGVVVSEFSIYVPAATDLDEADRIVYDGATYQIECIERRAYGGLAHLKADASRVTP